MFLLQGDSAAGVRTLTVQLGTAAPFWSCIWILTVAYVAACGYSVVTAGGTGVGGSAGALMPASLSLGAGSLPVKALVSAACSWSCHEGKGWRRRRLGLAEGMLWASGLHAGARLGSRGGGVLVGLFNETISLSQSSHAPPAACAILFC